MGMTVNVIKVTPFKFQYTFNRRFLKYVYIVKYLTQWFLFARVLPERLHLRVCKVADNS